MADAFRQYIKIRTFLGYRPKEILLELQNAFGDEAPNYASVQRWSKRFRDAVDSPLGSPLASQSNFETRDTRSNQELDVDEEQHNSKRQTQINANAKQSESSTSAKNSSRKSRRSRASRSKVHESRTLINE